MCHSGRLGGVSSVPRKRSLGSIEARKMLTIETIFSAKANLLDSNSQASQNYFARQKNPQNQDQDRLLQVIHE